MWLWVRGQIERHFADCLLVALIFAMMFIIITHSVFKQMFLNQPTVPENIAWAREEIAAIIGCLLGRLSRIDARSDEPPKEK